MSRYDNMIDILRPHARMPMSDINRAAQFSPFAALTGYDEKVRETARLTDDRIEVADEISNDLDLKISILQNSIDICPEVDITYFIPDAESHMGSRKSGGSYVSYTGTVKKIDTYSRRMIFTDLTEIEINRITEINSTLFRDFDLNSI